MTFYRNFARGFRHCSDIIPRLGLADAVAEHGATMPLFIEALPEDVGEVGIGAIEREALPSALLQLLRLTLYTPVEPRRFFSVTVTTHSISLVGPRSQLATVPGIELDPSPWRVISVREDWGGSESVGLVERVTTPLASARVPCFGLSGYDEHCVLVPSSRLDEALQLLSPAASAQQHAGEAAASGRDHVTFASSPLSSSPPSSPERSPTLSPQRSPTLSPTSAEFLPPALMPSPRPRRPAAHRHPITVLDTPELPTRLLRLDRSHRLHHAGALTRLLFVPQEGDPPLPLVSFTEAPETEISVLTSSPAWWDAYYAGFSAPFGLQQDPCEWVPVVTHAGLNETGVTAAASGVLAANRISLLNNSTFAGAGRVSADFTLIPRDDLETAVFGFETHRFKIQLGEPRTADGRAPSAATTCRWSLVVATDSPGLSRSG